MQPAYTPVHFRLEEFLPPELFNRLKDANALWKGWMLIDERMLRSVDQFRNAFGPLTINNWHSGGVLQQRGLRVPGQSFYKETSQHSYGRACDLTSTKFSGEEMRRYILANKDKFPYLKAMEHSVTWLHADVRNCEPITLVSP